MDRYIAEHLDELVGEQFEEMFRKAILGPLVERFSDEDVIAILRAYALEHMTHIRQAIARDEESIARGEHLRVN